MFPVSTSETTPEVRRTAHRQSDASESQLLSIKIKMFGKESLFVLVRQTNSPLERRDPLTFSTQNATQTGLTQSEFSASLANHLASFGRDFKHGLSLIREAIGPVAER